MRSKTTTNLYYRWLKWNIRGEGKRKSTPTSRSHYTGPIFYTYTWPIRRLAQLPGGNWACLHKGGYLPENPPEWDDDGGPRLTTTLHVPDLAAFSHLDGDWLPDNEMHDRLKMIWLKSAAAIIELVEDTPTPNLSIRNLQMEIKGIARDYNLYSAAFKLGWGDFPGSYADDLDLRVTNKLRTYRSDKEVAKRERRVARAEAKKALGLDGEN